ncbi:MAG: L,D-transpeptidase [Rhizobiaceae bacterium]|nr:L,D-transpeptidase [Rhizobiaceae bacterium]
MNATIFDGAPISRRMFLNTAALGAAAAMASACTTTPRRDPDPIAPKVALKDMYGVKVDGGFTIPAIPIEKVQPRLFRQIVRDPTGEKPGTVVVDTKNHYLYWTLPGGDAMRYGVGLGKQGFEWSGRAVVQWKQAWPKWTPPAEMIQRRPELAKYSAENGGMPGGLDNPLGARALYLFQNNEDTLYRLHGSPEWWSIGQSVSSGCVRLMNQDIIDLYDRVPSGTTVVVA